MFDITLATGKTFTVDTVNERVRAETGTRPRVCYLYMDITTSPHDLEEYYDMIHEDGALEKIEVSINENVVTTYTKYKYVNYIDSRIHTDGTRIISINLSNIPELN